MRTAALVAYRAASDIVGKAALFVITVVAARRLSPEGFGIFAIGTTVGWIAVVASDFGLQMHLARSVAREPEAAGYHLRRWLRLRLALAFAALLVVAASLTALGASRIAPAILLFTLGYLAAGMVEFIHHFYRGLSRTDLESTLTLWHRLGTLAAACLVLWRWPEPAALAAAMVVPPLATAVVTLRMASRMAPTSTIPVVPPVGPPSAEFLRDVAPIGAGVLLSALYFRLDVFLLEAWQGTETVGLYNAVFRLIDALRLFPAALLAVMLPTLVRSATIRPLAQTATALTAFGIAVAVGTLAERRASGHDALRAVLRRRRSRVPSARRGVSADVAELRADAAVGRVEWPPRIRRALPGGARRQRRLERALHPDDVAGRRRVGDAGDGSAADRGLRRAAGARHFAKAPGCGRGDRHDMRAGASILRHPSIPAAGLTSAELAIARSVVYASLFDYPLTLAQLRQTLIESIQTPSQVLAAYNGSAALQDAIEFRDGFFFPEGRADLVDERRRRETRSRAFLHRNRRLLQLVCALPYVRMVALSGSIAHLNLEGSGDLDLFIVTRGRRVWSTTVAVLVLAKLLRRRRIVCANFVVADTRLVLEQQDLFAASQVIHLKPLLGRDVFLQLLEKNPFLFRFYPNFHAADAASLPFRPSRVLGWLQKILEIALAPVSPLAELMCRAAYRGYLRRRAATWRSPEQVRLQVDCLKLHTQSHRQSVLERFDRSVRSMTDI